MIFFPPSDSLLSGWGKNNITSPSKSFILKKKKSHQISPRPFLLRNRIEKIFSAENILGRSETCGRPWAPLGTLVKAELVWYPHRLPGQAIPPSRPLEERMEDQASQRS